MKEPLEPLLKTKDIATIYGLSEYTVRRLARQRSEDIPPLAFRQHRKLRWRPEDVVRHRAEGDTTRRFRRVV